MSIERKGKLPAPFENIRFRFHIYSDGGAYLEYIGPLNELERAGVITEDMRAQLFKRSPGKERRNANGDHFFAHRKATKSDPTRAKIVRCVQEADRARSLPGVAAAFTEGIHLQRDRHGEPANQYGQNIWDSSALVEKSEASDRQQRSRTVGRFQRLARWTVSEKLIVVDWAGMARERVEAQAG